MSFTVRASRDLDWIAKRTQGSYSTGARAIEAIDRAGRRVGMVGYDNWTPNSAEISIALESPIAWRALAKPAFQYPFSECDKGLLLARISSANKRSLQLTEHVGFKPTYRIEDAITPGVHLVLFEMRREHCRWLGA